MMNEQHLSDEAVAACADGMLGGAAQDRATRHIAGCAECAHAVKVQREAVWALRAAPAPALPTALLARLRDVPQTTPLPRPTTAIGPDGSAVLSTFAPMAAFVAGQRGGHRTRNVVIAAAAVALTGALAAGTVAHAADRSSQTGPGHDGSHPVSHPHHPHGAPVAPAGVVVPLGR